MPEPIGEAFIEIKPLFTGFREEVRRGVASAASGAQAQVAQATRTIGSGAIVAPAGIRSVAVATDAAAVSATKLGTATKTAAKETEGFQNRQAVAAASTGKFAREVQDAERSTARFTRGTLAAAAATSGLFRAVSFASGAFLVGAVAGGAIAAAVQKFRDEAILASQTEAIIKATGDAAHVTAGQVDELAKSQALLTGISSDVVHQGENVLLTFKGIRNEVGAGNAIFTRAAKDLLDISSVMHTNVSSSAIQLGKALQDPERGVTALRRSGITLTVAQRTLIKELVATGRTLTAQKVVLKAIEDQVGGTARAVGETLPGRLNILKERARESLAEYVKRISESKKATELFNQAVGTATGVIAAFKKVVATLGPPLLFVTQATLSVAKALGGAQALLVAAAAYKTVTVSANLFAVAQGRVTKAVLLATGALTAEDAALLGAGSFKGRTPSSLAGTTFTGVQGAKDGEVAIGAIGTASQNAKLGVKALGSTLAAFATSTTGVAIGVGALALGIFKLNQVLKDSPGHFTAAKHALDGLNSSITELNRIRGERAGRSEDLSLGNLNVTAAQDAVAAAQAALSRTNAQPGSVEFIFLTNKLADAEQKLAGAERQLASARRASQAAIDKQRNAEKSNQRVIADTTKRLNDQIAALVRRSTIQAQRTLPGGEAASQVGAVQASVLKDFLRFTGTLEQSSSKLNQTIGKSLTVIAQTLGKIPNTTQINLVVKAAGADKQTKQILAALGILDPSFGGQRGFDRAEQNRLNVVTQTSATQAQIERGLRAALKTDQQRLAVAHQIAVTKRQELQAAQDAVRTAREQVTQAQQALSDARQALADSRQAARDAQQNVADTIKAARQQINQAVTDAKNNLTSLGQSIADLLQQAGIGLKGAGGAVSAEVKRLRDQVIRGQGGPETQQAAQRIAAQAQAAQAAGAPDLQRKFADLTDAFERGRISLPNFLKAFNALIAGIDVKGVRAKLGSAAANQLADLIAALKKQAALIAGGPQRPGGGGPPALVRPLQAVADAARQIAQARRDEIASRRAIVDAQRGVRNATQNLADAERSLRRAQTAETKANTAAIKANTKASNRLRAVINDKANLNQPPKPKGAASRTANSLTDAGATAP